MSDTIADSLRQLGLSDDQAGRLVRLHESGRTAEYFFDVREDGDALRRQGERYVGYLVNLLGFSKEGDLPQRVAAALWDHVAPDTVGRRPGFLRDADAAGIKDVLVRMDQEFYKELDHLRSVVKDALNITVSVYNHLSDRYQTTSEDDPARDKLRAQLAFAATLDEKIRDVINFNVKEVDLKKEVTDYGYDVQAACSARAAGREYMSSYARQEKRAYEAEIARASRLLDKLRGAGIEVQTGVVFREPPPALTAADFERGLTESRGSVQDAAATAQKTPVASRAIENEAQGHTRGAEPAAQAYWGKIAAAGQSALVNVAKASQSMGEERTEAQTKGRSR